tara:strand:+ start:1033 stop:1515 length:483 start_codon:yes stop_codon:yes gene_type:complete
MSPKPNTIVFGPFETHKTSFLTAYLLNLDEDITYCALNYTKLGNEETQKATPELVGFKDIENKKGILVFDADVLKNRMDPNIDTKDKYVCIYRFDTNIIEASIMDEIIKKQMNNIIDISKTAEDIKEFIKLFIIRSIPTLINDIDSVIQDFDKSYQSNYD